MEILRFAHDDIIGNPGNEQPQISHHPTSHLSPLNWRASPPALTPKDWFSFRDAGAGHVLQEVRSKKNRVKELPGYVLYRLETPVQL
jgi:hypothetical protein